MRVVRHGVRLAGAGAEARADGGEAMGGILGQIETQQGVDPAAFARMLATLSARGPDGSGTRILRQGRVALGHRRLAILDLSENAAQPLTNEDGTLWLTFNGEIYNFRELRKQLETQGHVLRSTSDSEVILHAYEEWGDDCVLRLRGIFAFGLWDDRRERLLLARDRLGVKPLYYWAHADGLVFASQPRAILEHPRFRREVDPRAFQHYLMYGCVPGDLAIWAGMNKLPAAHRLALDRRGVRRERYWELRYAPVVRNAAEAARLVRDKLDEVVRMQLASDVPVGVLLSSAVETSATAAIATRARERRLPSFSVGLDAPGADELASTRRTSAFLDTASHEESLTHASALGLLSELAGIHDEPCFSHASLRALAGARLARRHGVPVILCGDGASELFAGQPWYDVAAASRWAAWRRLGRKPGASGTDLPASHLARVSPLEGFPVEQLLFDASLCDVTRLFRRFDQASAPRTTRLQLIDLQTLRVDDGLLGLDHASMANGVEARVPFLDHELVEAVFSIDARALIVEGERKALLRRAAASWLPPEILGDGTRSSSGALDDGLRGPLDEGTTRLLRGGILVSHRLLRPEGVAAVLASGRRSATALLLQAEIWARRWLEPIGVE